MNVTPSDPWLIALARRAQLQIVQTSADLIGAIVIDGLNTLRIIGTSGSGSDPVFTDFPNLELENVQTGAKSLWNFVNRSVEINEPGRPPLTGTLLHHILAKRINTPDTELLQIVTAAVEAGGQQFNFVGAEEDDGCQLHWILGPSGEFVPKCRQFSPCDAPSCCHVVYTLEGPKCACY